MQCYPSANVTLELLQSSLQNLIVETAQRNNQLHEELRRDLKEYNENLGKEIAYLEKENLNLKSGIADLNNKLRTIERRQKEYNLIKYGLQGDTPDETNSGVLTTFNDILKVDCGRRDLRDVYRIGSVVQEGKPRPVVVEVVHYDTKQSLLGNLSRLKDTGIFIAIDYSTEDYQERKYLGEQLKIAKESEPLAEIQEENLLYRNKKYTLQDLKQNLLGFSLPSTTLLGMELEEKKCGRSRSDEIDDIVPKRTSSRSTKKK
ncbi:unnamed protein product [Phaedon cochleariae]|uniref:Uncharacterized protein n=1 Tax=Phaedon cochleariae TaxID=80249 RepID=A0A9N9SFU8_PHACE|nr:unnamed protein product [Phaedon cochleariae]